MNDPGFDDRRGWNDLVEEFHSGIYAFSWHMLGSRQEAEDVTQETFLKAYRSRASLRTNNVKAWLYSIARNACLDRKRWWKRWRGYVEGAAFDSCPGPESRLRQNLGGVPPSLANPTALDDRPDLCHTNDERVKGHCHDHSHNSCIR